MDGGVLGLGRVAWLCRHSYSEVTRAVENERGRECGTSRFLTLKVTVAERLSWWRSKVTAAIRFGAEHGS